MSSYNPHVQPRLQSDRRMFPRLGRRSTDLAGLSPLVMVVEPDPARRALTQEILAVSRFAVVPTMSVDGAVAICQGLLPAVIVCAEGEVGGLRARLPPMGVPIVATASDLVPGELIERIRGAIRSDVMRQG